MIPPAESDAPKKHAAPSAPRGGGWWWPWLAGLLLLAARLWRLADVPFPDHDSGRNWLIAGAISGGDFRDLFVHLSPTWYLLHAPLVGLSSPHFHRLLAINALLGVVGVAWLARTIARAAAASRLDEGCLALVIGLSTYYVWSGRELALNSPGLLLLAGIGHQYWRRLCRPEPAGRRRALLGAVAWLAVGLTVNYRLVLLLPVAVVAEGVYRSGGDRTLSLGTLARAMGLLTLPFIVYSGVAEVVGLPWYRLPAAWGGLLRNHVAPHGGEFDGTFYLRYLVRFESPLALVGLVAGPWLIRRLEEPARRRLAGALLALGGGGLVLASMMVAKAPRGLLLVVAPLTILGVWAVWERFGARRRALARTVLLAAAIAQLGTLWREIWRWYPPAVGLSAHAQVAAWLREHGARQVATTSALGVAPYAVARGVEVIDVPTPDSLRQLVRHRTVRYVLADGYRFAVGFDSLPSGVALKPILQLAEPALLPPLLFLEHAEYQFETYEQALARQRRAAREPAQLILYDVQR